MRGLYGDAAAASPEGVGITGPTVLRNSISHPFSAAARDIGAHQAALRGTGWHLHCASQGLQSRTHEEANGG